MKTSLLPLFCGLALLTACSSTYELVFRGDATMNRNGNDADSPPCPALVRVMPIRNPDAFLAAAPGKLWEAPKSVLQADMFGDAPTEITIKPGSARDPKLQPTPDNNVLRFKEVPAEATHFGLIAKFYRSNGVYRIAVKKDEVKGSVVELRGYDLVQTKTGGAPPKPAEPKSGDS